ncbi:MAG: nucleotide sugar dehydrogenase [Elusimicrobia bacterium]|nr:nucleotide sugar dehydrogenase [Elusimicrobiota bacterium]
MENLKKLISTGKAKIGIIGLGYVGLPLAVEFAEKGFAVTGFEVDAEKIKAIKAGKSYILDVPQEQVSRLYKRGLLNATHDYNALAKQDAIIICVPTPLRKSKDPDVSYIVASTDEIKKRLRKGQLIILESTTYPGTTVELTKPVLEEFTGLKAGKDFFLAFSPERVDPGNKKFGIPNTPKVVGGYTKTCGDLAAQLYGVAVHKVVKVSSTEAAEMVKLVENTFRAVNIGLVNEIALMCHRLGLNVWEVLDAAASKPFGFMPFQPGPGIGGHCIPLDPHYLGWKMRMLNFEPRFIDLAGVINSGMPEYVAQRTGEALNMQGKCLNGSKILVLGLAYKPDISDPRESPAMDVIAQLEKTHAHVEYHDPYVSCATVEGQKMRSVPLTAQSLKKYDCVVIVTNHSCIDYEMLVKNAKLVLDTRNATKRLPPSKNVCLL